MTVLKMTDLDLAGKRVLIREDLNVPVKDGVVKSDARILASLPTIKLALEKGAAVMVCSHLGRPTEGEFSAENSLQPVAPTPLHASSAWWLPRRCGWCRPTPCCVVKGLSSPLPTRRASSTKATCGGLAMATASPPPTPPLATSMS